MDTNTKRKGTLAIESMNKAKQYNVHQFDVWFADLTNKGEGSHLHKGRRPVVVISNEAANKHSPIISVVPLTSQVKKAKLPTHVLLDGIGKCGESLAMCEQVRSIDKSDLVNQVGQVTDKTERQNLIHSICVQFGIVNPF